MKGEIWVKYESQMGLEPMTLQIFKSHLGLGFLSEISLFVSFLFIFHFMKNEMKLISY